ncbi:MAG: septum formation initiator family protein [Eubacterium sp.]|nr:septum formation initiator family protein [Eubacterium sp.]
MTNTNDFRKYSYSNDPATLISAFTYTRDSRAQKLREQPKTRESEIRIRENNGIKSKSQLKAEQKQANLVAVRIVAVALVFFLVIGFVINSFAYKNQLTREIASTEIDVANAQSEYISLQAELNSLVSVSMIDKYAVEKLGMTKVRSNQIQYMNVDEFKAEREKKLSAQKDVDAGIKNLRNKIKGHN